MQCKVYLIPAAGDLKAQVRSGMHAGPARQVDAVDAIGTHSHCTLADYALVPKQNTEQIAAAAEEAPRESTARHTRGSRPRSRRYAVAMKEDSDDMEDHHSKVECFPAVCLECCMDALTFCTCWQ